MSDFDDTEVPMFERGMARRREVLGDAHVDAASAAAGELDSEFQRFITNYAWGEVWAGDDLPRGTRSAITIALLAALGHEDELAMHVRSAHGWVSMEELRGVLMHVAIYAGVPAANTAFRIARDVLGELEGFEDGV